VRWGEKRSAVQQIEIVDLFDGELVKDRGEEVESFLIFDALVVNHRNVMALDFHRRLTQCQTHVNHSYLLR